MLLQFLRVSGKLWMQSLHAGGRRVSVQRPDCEYRRCARYVLEKVPKAWLGTVPFLVQFACRVHARLTPTVLHRGSSLSKSSTMPPVSTTAVETSTAGTNPATPVNVKLLLIGNASVGKSSLLLRFSDEQWIPEDEATATIGVDFRVSRLLLCGGQGLPKVRAS